MTLSLFDQQLFEKVVDEKFKDKKEFNRTEVLIILNEMTKAEKYYPKGQLLKGAKYKVFKYFVRYCLYRNLANYDTMLLISGSKGTGKSSFSIMLAREWCILLGIPFSPRHHMAYSNSQVQERIDNLPRFHPLICLGGTTKIIIKSKGKESYESINKLVGRNDFEVKTYNKTTDEFEFIKPEKCIETAHRAKVYTIELENGTKIKATDNHQFLTNRGYVALKDLTESDEIIINSEKCAVCQKEFIPKNCQTKYCSVNCRDKHRSNTINYIEKQKQYRLKNKTILKKKNRQYRENNSVRIKAQKKIDRQKNRDKYIQKNKEYYIQNKKDMLEKHKQWISANKTKVRNYYNDRHKKLMQSNAQYAILKNLRRRMSLALKEQDTAKHQSFSKFIGCTILELKTYLEGKFVEGMTWNNYGSKWHVDHIIPCAKWDLSKLENQQKCFNYTNLQPLWAKDNLKKGAKC